MCGVLSMKNIQEFKNNIISTCNVVSLQVDGAIMLPISVPDSDLIIDLNSDIQSCCDSENEINKTFLPSEYNFEQDIKRLIEFSKQFQIDYENEKVQTLNGVTVDDSDNSLDIKILTSTSNSLRRQKTPSEVNLAANDDNDDNSYYFSKCSSKKENVFSLLASQRKKISSPKLPNPGPFGTGIIRPLPKKHSCVQSNDTASLKRPNHRTGRNVRPYTVRYYNFDRTHPELKLVENSDSIIPKRISKESSKMTDKPRSGTKGLLLNKGLTWHEFFERSNVYSAKSLQSSYGNVNTHTTATQTAISESVMSPKSGEINKIQKHILPQLNIRAECCVQRIPEISIAPNSFQRTVQSNIKLVEVIYEESSNQVKNVEVKQNEEVDSCTKENKKTIEFQSDSKCTTSVDSVGPMEINENSKLSESSKISITTLSNKASENNGYDSSLDESISLYMSRGSVLTSALTDHDTIKRALKDKSVQTQKLKRFAKHRKDTIEKKVIISTSDCSEFEYDGKCDSIGSVSLSSKNLNFLKFPNHFLLRFSIILFSFLRHR